MTHVAIIGNSHLAAFADAAPQITARHPGVTLSFFGLDNPLFFKSDALKGKALRVADDPMKNGRQIIDPKANHALDFNQFDLVLLSAHGFYLRHLFEALGRFNILGLRPVNDTGPYVSQACLSDAMAAHIKNYANRLGRFFPRSDNAVVVQMPYPALSALDFSDALAGLYAQPDRAVLFKMFNTLVHETMFAKGLTFQPVPDAFLHSPFFTKPTYARRTAMEAGTEPALTDHLHMNASYAADFFDEIHAGLLGR